MSVFRPGLFKGKVCVVTGGGTGIGKAVATELASLGAQVILASRTFDRLQETAAKLNATIGQKPGTTPVQCVPLNIRDEERVNATMGELIERYGKIDCLVNNGGGQFASPAGNIGAKGWRAVIDTNVNGTWYMCRALYCQTPPLKRPGMAIVNVTADFHNGFPGMAHTGAARAAVDNLQKTLCREWGPEGIRINSIAPGIILSSGVNNYPLEYRKNFFVSGESVPSGRPGTESECASSIVFLLSPAAAYVNGATLRVDGGGSLSKKDFVTSNMLEELREVGGETKEALKAAIAKATPPFHTSAELEGEYKERYQKEDKPMNSKL